jgi:hypothetical protein
MRTAEEIVNTYRERKKAWQPVMAKRMELRDAYNGDTPVPLPELDKNEQSAVANLIALGLDQIAMRVASTSTDIVSPALKPGFKGSEELARTRRQAAFGWMEENELPLKNYRRSRKLIGYAASPVLIQPDPVRGIPQWYFSDPLATYPAPMDDPDDMCPTDCIVGFERALGWLKQRYPREIARLRKSDPPKPDDKYEVLRYVDAEQLAMIVVGRSGGYGPQVGEDAVVLEWLPNKAGMCLAVVPQRITLDRPQGQFDQMIGLYRQQAMLMALEVIAVKKGVLPTTVIESFPNAPGLPELITGDTIHPGWSGLVNIIKNGTIRELVSNPGYQTFPTIDRLERAQRLSGGVPQEFGGESTSNIRTGRRGDSVISATVDFTIQENQRVLAASQNHELEYAMEVSKGWFGKQPKSFYVSYKGAQGHLDYVPDKIFEDGSRLISSYSHAGSDINGLNIAIGQMMGTGLMSTETGREIHPYIDDPEKEHDRTTAEALERAMLSSIEQQAAQGQIPPNDVARIMELVVTNRKSLSEAVMTAQREAQERQAQQVPPTAPEAQPGLAQPDMGAEAGIAPPQDSMPSAGNLASLLGQLRRPQMSLASEQAPA